MMASHDVASNVWQALVGGLFLYGGQMVSEGAESRLLGRAVQVDPNKPTLKAPGTKRLKLKYDKVLSSFAGQGLTLVHFSAQRKRFLWDRGCIEGLFRGCSGGLRGSGGIRGCVGCILCQKRLRLS